MTNPRAGLCLLSDSTPQSLTSGDGPTSCGRLLRSSIPSGKRRGVVLPSPPDFLSPVTKLAKTLKNTDLNIDRQVTRRRLSLDHNVTPPPPLSMSLRKSSVRQSSAQANNGRLPLTRHAFSLLSNSPDSDHDSPYYLQARCATRARTRQSAVLPPRVQVMEDCQQWKPPPTFHLDSSPPLAVSSTTSSPPADKTSPWMCTRSRDTLPRRVLRDESAPTSQNSSPTNSIDSLDDRAPRRSAEHHAAQAVVVAGPTEMITDVAHPQHLNTSPPAQGSNATPSAQGPNTTPPAQGPNASPPVGLSDVPGCNPSAVVVRRPCTAYGIKQLLCSPILEQDETRRQLRAVTKRRRINLNDDDQENINPVFRCATELKKDRELINSFFKLNNESKPKTLSQHGRGVMITVNQAEKENDVPCRAKRVQEQDHERCGSSSKKCKMIEGGGGCDVIMSPVTQTTMTTTTSSAQKRMLLRSHSDMKIKTALHCAGERSDLIGDLSRPFSLPMIVGKHPDLKAITEHTLARLVEKTLTPPPMNETPPTEENPSFTVVDCRYPYEFEGGHIAGAINVYTDEGIVELLANSRNQSKDTTKKPFLVFHCEFSSRRGPRMMHLLRNRDRESHVDDYPTLSYPELYLLEGGYKAFFDAHPSLCRPSGYTPMSHDDHQDDLKHFRKKSKSWAGEKCVVGVGGADGPFGGLRVRSMSKRNRPT